MLTVEAPAKVNLFLRILGKRADGYHELASLFHTLDLKDTLTLSLAHEDSLNCSECSIKENLVTRAVDLFRRKTGLYFRVAIHLEKRIPLQAGLGGGSSDAAATLKGLNALLNHPVTSEELQLWSQELGSDIPFFFSTGTAYCTGRGEKVRDLPNFRFDEKITLYKPKGGLSTQAVYQALDLATCSKEDPEALLDKFLRGEREFINDLEGPAFRLRPSLKKIKSKFKATMSGSGTAFFYL